jgi:hypothetical protein
MSGDQLVKELRERREALNAQINLALEAWEAWHDLKEHAEQALCDDELRKSLPDEFDLESELMQDPWPS